MANCTTMPKFWFFQIIHLILKSYTFLAKRRCRWNATVSQEPSALAASALCFSGRPLLYRPPSALADSAMLSFCLDFSSHFFSKNVIFPVKALRQNFVWIVFPILIKVEFLFIWIEHLYVRKWSFCRQNPPCFFPKNNLIFDKKSNWTVHFCSTPINVQNRVQLNGAKNNNWKYGRFRTVQSRSIAFIWTEKIYI